MPVVYVDLPPEQAKLLNLALNKISGEWDQELLARLLAELDQEPNADLTLSGFAEDEVARLLKTLDARERRGRAESFDLDAALEEARAAPGVSRAAGARRGDAGLGAGALRAGGVRVKLAGRLTRLEHALEDRELWREVERISSECGVPPEEVFADAEQLLDRELEAAGLSTDDALRQWAEEEGLNPDEVVREAERLQR